MIYENVKRYADKQKLSISELEKRAGISNGTIAKWQQSNPKISSVIAVASVLHVKVDSLIKEARNE